MIGLQELARALGGEVIGASQVAAPAPGHSARDRSLVVRLSSRARDGYVVYGFAGEDWRSLRDHVRECVGGARYIAPEPREAVARSDAARMRLAQMVWGEARSARDSLAERYLRGRKLDLPPNAERVLGFLPNGVWKIGEIRTRSPMMVAAMRSVATGEVVAVHRTKLSHDGQKLDRRMLGHAGGAAIMLDELDGDELTVAEGVESGLAGRHLGFSPVWALGTAGAIAAFAVLPEVRTLRILAENDETNLRAVRRCAARWHAALKRVVVVTPQIGNDMADVWAATGGAL